MTVQAALTPGLGHRPDWWLQAAADAQTTAHKAILAGADQVEWLTWLAERVDWLLYLAERSQSGPVSYR